MRASERSLQFAGGTLGGQRHICTFFNSIDEETLFPAAAEIASPSDGHRCARTGLDSAESGAEAPRPRPLIRRSILKRGLV